MFARLRFSISFSFFFSQNIIIFSRNRPIWVSTNKKFYSDFRSKMYRKKNPEKICLSVPNLFLQSSFFLLLFQNNFCLSEISIKFSIFYTHIDLFLKKILCQTLPFTLRIPFLHGRKLRYRYFQRIRYKRNLQYVEETMVF